MRLPSRDLKVRSPCSRKAPLSIAFQTSLIEKSITNTNSKKAHSLFLGGLHEATAELPGHANRAVSTSCYFNQMQRDTNKNPVKRTSPPLLMDIMLTHQCSTDFSPD